MNWFTRAYHESQRRLRRRRRIDLFTVLFVVILMPLLAMSCLLYTCRSARAAKIRTLEEMQRERIHLQGERDELSRALAELSSRKRIVHYASERLGMHFPEPDDVVVILFEPGSGQGGTEAGPPVETGDFLAGSPPGRGSEASPIRALTQFFALYVF